MKTIYCATLLCFLQSASIVFGVGFQFAGQVSKVYGTGAADITNLVQVGMPYSGTVSYSPALAALDADPSPNSGLYRFNPGDLLIQATVGANSFSATPSSFGYVTVAFELPSPVADGITYEMRGVYLNGTDVPGATDTQTLDLSLSTTNLSALASDALPPTSPRFDDYPTGGGNGFREMVFYTYKNGSFYYGFSGPLTALSALPQLSTRITANQLVLSWPTNAAGFQLQSTPTPEFPNSWNAVTVQPSVQNDTFQTAITPDQSLLFFRLVQALPP